MKKFVNRIAEFLKEEDGPTAVEYAVMLSLIVIFCLSSISLVGNNADAKFKDVADKIAAGTATN
ncbi:MAG: Flp family type IVb pilin [Planctomycetota bacterium]